MRFTFSGLQDVHEPLGWLHFGANSLRLIGQAVGLPPLGWQCEAPADDGGYWLYGYENQSLPPREGRKYSDLAWRIVRCKTSDGLGYGQVEVVHSQSGDNWLGHGAIVHNSTDGSFLALKFRREPHAAWAFGSKDGSKWKPLADKPVIIDHDAFGLLWDAGSKRYIDYQTTYQKWNRRLVDNQASRNRRVLSIRTSEDGVHWQPDYEVRFRKMLAPEDDLITPDERDPPDLEFYWFREFRYCGRYVGMMLNYAPSPQNVNPWGANSPDNEQSRHGPWCSGEWWISQDGLTWRRPWPDVFANGQCDETIRHEPMRLGGRLLWNYGGKVFGLDDDRIYYVGSLCNAEFSTPVFEMPARHINLNASLNFHGDDSRGMQTQAYIMAELTDPDGDVIDGYEKERCAFTHLPGNVVPLSWTPGQHVLSPLAGRKVRLRFYLRDARVYSVRDCGPVGD